MKAMSTTLIALCVAARIASAQAQAPVDPPTPPPAQHGPHGPHGPPGLDIDRLTVLLDLDPYQKGVVQQALTEQRDAMRTARKANETSGTRPSFAEAQAQRTQAQQQLISKLSGVLSDSQITKLKVLMEPRGGPGAGFRGPAPGAGTGDGNAN